MSQDKKEEILAKAVQLFLKKGYEKASMRDLGKAVGIQAPGLYYYFKNKKQILQQINDESWQKFHEMILDEAKKVADPEEKIKLYIRNMIKYQFILAEKTLIVDDSIPIRHIKGRREEERIVFSFLRDTLRELAETKGLRSNIDLTLAAFTLFSMVARVYRWYKPDGRLNLEELTEQMVRLFFHGFYGIEEEIGK
jgi:AcrR family transcriptional regulator